MTYKQYLSQLTEEQRAEAIAKRAAYWAQFGYTLDELDGKIAECEKELRKTIKAIRDGGTKLFNEFPKAMMTDAQVAKHTATVNCGARFKRGNANEASLKLAEQVMADERFADFLAKYEMAAHIELSKDGGYQIRLSY